MTFLDFLIRICWPIQSFFPRNILAVIPFLSLFSGASIDALCDWRKSALS